MPLGNGRHFLSRPALHHPDLHGLRPASIQSHHAPREARSCTGLWDNDIARKAVINPTIEGSSGRTVWIRREIVRVESGLSRASRAGASRDGFSYNEVVGISFGDEIHILLVLVGVGTGPCGYTKNGCYNRAGGAEENPT